MTQIDTIHNAPRQTPDMNGLALASWVTKNVYPIHSIHTEIRNHESGGISEVQISVDRNMHVDDVAAF
jgi:hypothetical protein